MALNHIDLTKLIARIDELEMKVAYQDDTVSALNDSLVRQELELQKLWDANRLLKKQLDEVDSGANSDEAPPPHY